MGFIRYLGNILKFQIGNEMSCGDGLKKAGDQDACGNVVDNGSTIRINRLRTHLVGNKVFVQIETNRKVTGWGEVSALEPRTANLLLSRKRAASRMALS